MPKKMTPEERAAYQRDYRARKKALPDNIDENGEELLLPITEVPPTRTVLVGEPPVPVVVSDRDLGLPRSNYYSKPEEKGGWTETIRNIDPHLAQRILDHPAIKTKR